MAGWNIADVLDAVAREVPESPAVICGNRRFNWREFDDRAENVAGHLAAVGLKRQDKVAQYLRNCPEYLESFIAALKAAMVPVNTNYRYGPSELAYLWTDAEARAVVFAASFAETIEQMRSQVPGVISWLWVDDTGGMCPEWATPYEDIAGSTPAAKRVWGRDGDDIVLLYTGGTTGLPKGVMWRQDDLFVKLGNASNGRYPDVPDLDYARTRIASHGRRHLPAAPLMHGAGCLTCLPVIARGGAVVLLESSSFSAEELLDTVERERVSSVGWVGDAFAKPVLAALEAAPHRWDLSSWSIVTSGGVLFSDEVKRGLIHHVPGLLIADIYGASETLEAARSIVVGDSGHVPARSFEVGDGIAVLTDEDVEVVPGSGEVGRVAFAGRRLPLGYYRDPAKTAATFRQVNGRRFSMTGDYAVVENDGRITVLGRGSSCINTGGEKVYPEEVEEVLKRHPSIDDVAILGIPDARFGEKIAAAVQLAPGAELDVTGLQDHVRHNLAGYKVPRVFVPVDRVVRGPSGKVDQAAVRNMLLAQVDPV